MNRNKIQFNELNKLYDEIYYSNIDEIEYSLDIITNLISEKEYEEFVVDVVGLSGIIDTIIDTLDELAEIFENEGLMDAYNLTKEKIDRIQSGELDEIIESEYERLDEENEDDMIDEDMIDEDMDELEDEEDYDDEYYEY